MMPKSAPPSVDIIRRNSSANAAPFAPFSASDSLAEWTTTAPGQNSWDPTLTPIYQKPGAPPLQDIQGFTFK
jgi:hypothetical protein